MGMTDKSLCNSCTNIGCEFQSGIVRTKCDFYMPPQLEPDNCGNYVIQEPTTKNNLGVDCISREQAKEAIRDKFKDLPSRVEINTILNELPSVTPQEPILDKIREEIGKAWHTKPKNRYEEGLKDQALKDVQIIDKYMANIKEGKEWE